LATVVVVSVLEAFLAEILQTARVRRASILHTLRFREAAEFPLNSQHNGAHVRASYD
jgi:hypothetical protein